MRRALVLLERKEKNGTKNSTTPRSTQRQQQEQEQTQQRKATRKGGKKEKDEGKKGIGFGKERASVFLIHETKHGGCGNAKGQ